MAVVHKKHFYARCRFQASVCDSQVDSAVTRACVGALHGGTVGWHENRNSQLPPSASPVPKDVSVVPLTPLEGVNHCVKLSMAFIYSVPWI